MCSVTLCIISDLIFLYKRIKEHLLKQLVYINGSLVTLEAPKLVSEIKYLRWK